MAVSWLLTVAHLGLLGEGDDSLGPANALSLVRACLPVRPWAAAIAVATDFADGRIARRLGQTAFGAYADPLADVTFWTAVAFRPEVGRWPRALVLGLWLVPTAVIAATYLARGRTIDYPRPVVMTRMSAVAQLLLTVDLVRRSRRVGATVPKADARNRQVSQPLGQVW